MRNKFTKQAQTALTLAKAAAIDFEPVIQSENREGSGECCGGGTEFWL